MANLGLGKVVCELAMASSWPWVTSTPSGEGLGVSWGPLCCCTVVELDPLLWVVLCLSVEAIRVEEAVACRWLGGLAVVTKELVSTV